MAFARCIQLGCPNKVREGLKRPEHDKTVNGKEKADGRLCWRCRDGRNSHLSMLDGLRETRRA